MNAEPAGSVSWDLLSVVCPQPDNIRSSEGLWPQACLHFPGSPCSLRHAVALHSGVGCSTQLADRTVSRELVSWEPAPPGTPLSVPARLAFTLWEGRSARAGFGHAQGASCLRLGPCPRGFLSNGLG